MDQEIYDKISQIEVKELNKEEYGELYNWLFEKKCVILKKKYIPRLYEYKEPYIYYTQELYELRQTEMMKRQAKLNDLGTSNLQNEDSYHMRLEHADGTFGQALELYAFLYKDEKWRKYIEENNLKGYLIKKLIDMQFHDIGHSLLCHPFEEYMGNKDCTHEMIGEKLKEDDSKFQSKVKVLLGKNYKESKDKELEPLHEGNADFDRQNYLILDSYYLGYPLVGKLMTKINSLTILRKDEQSKLIYSYKKEALPYLEILLKLRVQLYKEEYSGHNRTMTDGVAKIALNKILENEENLAQPLKNHIQTLKGQSIDKIDIKEFLKGDNCLWYNSLIEVAENSKDNTLKDIATCCIPNKNAIQKIKTKMQELKVDETDEVKKFYENVTRICEGKSKISKKLASDYKKDNMKAFYSDNIYEIFDAANRILANIETGKLKDNGVYTWRKKIKIYDEKAPLYIENDDGEFYELSKHPKRTLELKPIKIKGIYLITPLLKEKLKDTEKVQIIKKIIEEKSQKLTIRKNSQRIGTEEHKIKVLER